MHDHPKRPPIRNLVSPLQNTFLQMKLLWLQRCINSVRFVSREESYPVWCSGWEFWQDQIRITTIQSFKTLDRQGRALQRSRQSPSGARC
jgi:glycyl-tRNA synthetase alpha subunit